MIKSYGRQGYLSKYIRACFLKWLSPGANRMGPWTCSWTSDVGKASGQPCRRGRAFKRNPERLKVRMPLALGGQVRRGWPNIK